MSSTRTDIEIIGYPSVTPDDAPRPSIKRIRINGTEVATNGISIEGRTANGKYEQLLAVNVSLLPSSLRFVAPDNQPAPAVDGAVVEALAMAHHRVQELERQLDAHHQHDADEQQLLDKIAGFIARTSGPTDGRPLDVRVRALVEQLTQQANALQGELRGMIERERAVDAVVDAWDTERGNLKGYDKLGVLDPETPAGRVVELLRDLCKARPNTTESINARKLALDAIYAELGEYGLLQGNDGDYAESIVTATRAALADRADARQQLEAIERTIASIPAGDPAEGRTVADRVYAAFAALTEPARQNLDTGAAAAERIRAAATSYADDVEANLGKHNTAEASAYYAGMIAAASIAADETPEADPNVAHIDTVNGRHRPAQAPEIRDPDPTPGEHTPEGRGPGETE